MRITSIANRLYEAAVKIKLKAHCCRISCCDPINPIATLHRIKLPKLHSEL